MEKPVFKTPEEAEAAFYEAFQRNDLAAMMDVWADDDDIWCVHPRGERLTGRQAIAASWSQIFAAGTAVRFGISDLQCTRDNLLSVHCLHENISFGQRFQRRSTVIATNVYRITDSGWRLIVHHASVEDSADADDEDETPQTLH